MFTLVTCRCQFYLYILSFSSTVLLSTLPKFLLWPKRAYPVAVLKNFIVVDVSRFCPFFLRVQTSLPYKIMETASALYTVILENFWTKVGLSVVYNFQYLSKFC